MADLEPGKPGSNDQAKDLAKDTVKVSVKDPAQPQPDEGPGSSAAATEQAERVADTPPADSVPSAEEEKSGGGGIVGILGVLLALIALGVASFGAFTAWELKQQVPKDPKLVIQPELDALRLEIQSSLVPTAGVEMRDVEVRLKAGRDEDVARLTQLENRLDEGLTALKQQIGTSSEDWLLAEAEYLVRLANQRVVMERDPAAAIALFKAADEVIQKAEGVAAFSLREALANNIADLRAVKSLDEDGIFVRIGAVINQVDKLQQKRLSFEQAEAQLPVANDAATLLDRFVNYLQAAGQRLFALVDYRRDGEVITPILPLEEEYYLRQNLVLKLQLAQLGLLRGKQQVYAPSLAEASNWIGRHFDPEDPVTQSLLAELASLQSLDVSQPLPDVSDSLRAIRKMVDNFSRQSAPVEQP